MQDISRYITKETMISFCANGLVNSVIIWIVFGRKTQIPLLGIGGIAIDFIPQLGAISLVGCIVPALLARSRLNSGTICTDLGTARVRLRTILRNSLVSAICVTLVLGFAATAILMAIWPGPYEFREVFMIKAAAGCVVPFIITPRAISWALEGK